MTFLISTNPIVTISGTDPIMSTEGPIPVISIQDATTEQKGAVQLEDSFTSTSTTTAATPKSVKDSYDYITTVSGDLQTNIDGKSDTSHLHDDRYYTLSEVDTISGSLQSSIDDSVSNIDYSSAWDGVVDKAPSQNTVYDEMENRMVVGTDINGGSF